MPGAGNEEKALQARGKLAEMFCSGGQGRVKGHKFAKTGNIKTTVIV